MPPKSKVIKQTTTMVLHRKSQPERRVTTVTQQRSLQSSNKLMRYSNAVPVKGKDVLSFSSGSGGSTLIIRGSEVFSNVTASSTWKVYPFGINPSNVLMFPKLQGIATNFEEFRVHNLSLEYLTACPTTRSGSVSLMIDYDPTDDGPKSVLELMANESSVTGSLGENLSIRFDAKNQSRLWFYCRAPEVTNFSPTLTGEDLRQISAGTIEVCTDNCTSADVGLIGGYVRVSYAFEFRAMRPPPETFGAFTSSMVDSTTVSSGTSNVGLPLILENATGYTGLTGSNTLYPVPSNNLTTKANSFLLAAGQYALSTFWNWLGVGVVPSVSSNNARIKKRQSFANLMRPTLTRQTAVSTPDYFLVEEKKAESKLKLSAKPIAHRRDVVTQYSKIQQLPDGSFIGLPLGDADEWVPLPQFSEPEEPAPLATGDYSIAVVGYDIETGAGTTLLTNSGNTSGAISLERVLEIGLARPTCIFPNYLFADNRYLSIFDIDFAKKSGPE